MTEPTRYALRANSHVEAYAGLAVSALAARSAHPTNGYIDNSQH
jgi:hypothetical protein